MYKSKLQELCHRLGLPLPEYTVTRKGPDHDSKFQAQVTVNGVSFHSTPDKCKTCKEAENLAAHFAFEYFSHNPPVPSTIDPSLTEAHSHPAADPGVLPKVTSSHPDPVGSHETHDSDPLAGPQPVMGDDPSFPSKISAGAYKPKLLELCRKYRWKQPEYKTAKEGPDHMPRFAATVVVNDVAYVTPHQCRSSKEATNLAACVAFNQLARLGFSSTADHIDIKVHQNNERNAQPSDIRSTSLASREPSNSSEVLHVYKNQLQQYAQKQGLPLPQYSCETEGPPHDRRFRSRVAFSGKFYECQQFFTTLKEAEQAAAKVAVEAICPDEIQKGGGLFKTLLQELAQKLGFLFPTYKTVQSGPPHDTTFSSVVQIDEESYQGQPAKTKKQAELNAAEIAYNTLINCSDKCTKRQKTSTIPGTHIPHPPSTHNFSLCQ
ncbi:unnamed protein product [Cuscuta epithymum]|uniref:DRBM domain-containing protein n=1 Tax=Cuscuta epithymum TaxID=186058 RepID=A0AAV0EQ77_9ASTE|nr:unnamed protein product [Cuscuta epithymum]